MGHLWGYFWGYLTDKPQRKVNTISYLGSEFESLCSTRIGGITLARWLG